jgi:hypothetical protein
MSLNNQLILSVAAFAAVYYYLRIRRKDPVASSTPGLRHKGGDNLLSEMYEVPNKR